MTLTPSGVGGMGAYRGRGASRSMATRRGESRTGVVVMIASRRARTLGCKRGETWNTSSITAGRAVVGGKGVGRCGVVDRSSKSS